MRPVRLTLQGFKSHEGRTELDFSERSLFAIVGPTGSGKTTILDGISFALYAKTPKVRQSTKTLICSTKDSAEVELVFEAEGRTYTINRSIRTKGTPVHVLIDDAGERVTGETAVSDAVEELLRLDFNAFRSSVLLAQNQFDEFFRATPDTRMKILKGVFRFDQLDHMRDAAKTHRNEHEMHERELEGGLREIPEDAADQIAAARAEIEGIDERIAALEKIGPAEQKLTHRLEKAGEQLGAARIALEELERLREDLPAPKLLAHLVAADEQITGPLAKATKVVDELKVDHKKARLGLTEIETKLGKESALAALMGKADRLEEVNEGRTEAKTAVAGATAVLVTTKKALADTASAEKKAIDSIDKLEVERRALHAAHAAHGLRTGLHAGDPCPVCEQTIALVPKGKAPAAFDTIEGRIEKARAVASTATAAARAAADQHTAAEHTLGSSEKELTDLEGQANKLEAELTEALGKKTDPVAELEARVAKLTDARESLERLESDLNDAAEELEGLRKNADDLKEARDEVFTDLIAIASTLKEARVDRKASVAELSRAAQVLSEIIETRLAATTKQVAELGSAKDTVEAAIAELHRDAGLDPGQTVAGALSAASERKGALVNRILELEKQIARSKELVDELKKVRSQIEIYETLYSDLANTRFIDFLLEDKRRLLSELASHQLREMTGRYRFDDAGTFRVIDEFNADTKRGVDSLSGGETFLASLALALGLAESVTRHGGRLRCFFLDEGFGSLDSDSLQKALDGIERIATQDRLIGLVSHVQGVAERVIDKIELDRDENGMTIVKQPAMPALRVVG